MKIALVGVPGSGKTGLATRIQHERATESNHFVPTIYDGIPQALEEETGLAIGPLADYRTNLALLMRRQEALWDAPENIIMTTTFVDSVVYTSLQIAARYSGHVRDLNAADEGAMSSVAASSCVLRDSYTFDKTLYLPYTGDDELLREIDHAYRETFDVFQIPVEEVVDATTYS